MDDHRIVDLFFARKEQALIETEIKYGKYCYHVANNILNSKEDSEECVNDTYLHTWNAIPPTRPENLKAFVGKITRNLALDIYEKNHAQKRNNAVELVYEELEECITGSHGHAMVEDLALKTALNEFLDSLDQKKRLIFMQRYWYLSSVKDIAQRFKMSDNNVKAMLLRLRTKFKKFLEKEGVVL